jgi:gliding motility-associated-like protein
MKISLIFIIYWFPIVIFSQVTTIYSEDFSNDYKKGAVSYQGTSASDPTDGNWYTTNIGSPDCDGGSAVIWDDITLFDGAAVIPSNSTSFRWNDVNNGNLSNRVDWYSKSILGSYKLISISLDYEIGFGNNLNSVWAYYKIDGGNWTLFGSSLNQTSSSGTFSISNLNSTSSVQIYVKALTQDSDLAFVYIDNVLITSCSSLAKVSILSSAADNVICNGTSVTFNATPTDEGPNPSYQWRLNGVNVGVNSTTYSNDKLMDGDEVNCILTSTLVCGNTVPISIDVSSSKILTTVLQKPTITLIPPLLTKNRDTCFNTPIKDIRFFIGGAVTDVSVSGLPSGISSNYVAGILTISGTATMSGLFNYTISTIGGCSLITESGSINIRSVIPVPLVNSKLIHCLEDPIPNIIAESSFGGALTWSSDNMFSNVLVNGPILLPSAIKGETNYYVRESLNGCVGNSNEVKVTFKYCEIEIPTAFTPDGDNVNDDWIIKNIDEVIPNNIVSVYNRWGEKIFESTKGNYEMHKWDGKYNGKSLPVDSYYFIIEYNDSNRDPLKGIVTIIQK